MAHSATLYLPTIIPAASATRERTQVRRTFGLDVNSPTVSWPKLTMPRWQGSFARLAVWWFNFSLWHTKVALREIRSEVMRAFEPFVGPWLSAAALLAYSTTIRNNKLQAIIDATDLGTGTGIIRWYDGTRPATGGTVTTLLGTLTCANPSATKASGVLTFATITDDSSADATSTVTWGRVSDSSSSPPGTFCFDFNIATASADIIVNTAAIVTGAALSITSWTITDGNP